MTKEKLSLAIHAATLATSLGHPHLFIESSSATLFLSFSVIKKYVVNVTMLLSRICCGYFSSLNDLIMKNLN
jgi:hypothetical protein